jgi:hypothetical protein
MYNTSQFLGFLGMYNTLQTLQAPGKGRPFRGSRLSLFRHLICLRWLVQRCLDLIFPAKERERLKWLADMTGCCQSFSLLLRRRNVCYSNLRRQNSLLSRRAGEPVPLSFIKLITFLKHLHSVSANKICTKCRNETPLTI